jgi:OOP family OmpA-OmpF porin
MKQLIKRMLLTPPLVVLMLSGCTTMQDKNQPPPQAAAPKATIAPAPAMVIAPAPAPKPEKIVLEGVHFNFDKDTLKPSGAGILDHAVTVIKQNPDMRFNIGGHTDSVGSDQYNEGLAQRRANTVRNYLVQHGVASNRLDVSSYGERNPVASNTTAEGRAENRRVEIDHRIEIVSL